MKRSLPGFAATATLFLAMFAAELAFAQKHGGILKMYDQCGSPGLIVLIWRSVGRTGKAHSTTREEDGGTCARPMLGKPTGQLLTVIFSYLKSDRRGQSEPYVPLGHK